MAFFDFDSRLQKLLIFAALCSITTLPCGCNDDDYPYVCDDPGPEYHEPYPDFTEDIDGDEAVPDVPDDVDDPGEPDTDEEDVLEDAEDVDEEDDAATDVEDAPDDADEDLTAQGVRSHHGFVRGEILPASSGAEGIRLRFVTPDLPVARSFFTWFTSSGTLVPDGNKAVWYPEGTPGVHAVQAVARCDDVICLEVFRIRVPG
jgi:hypothetical protein